MANPVVAGNILAAGLRAEFANTYGPTYTAVKERLSSVMELGIPSDKAVEIFGYLESSPYPQRWVDGENIPSRNFLSRQFSVTNWTWGMQVKWKINDRQDDQTRSLFDQARAAGDHWATLPERLFFQILTSTADATLLPAIPNAPDGLALFAANRFGLGAGNIVATGGVATTAAVQANFFGAIAAFGQFQDTEGQPLWGQDKLDQGFTVIYNVANQQVFTQAFMQNLVQGTAAAPSNVIMNAGLNVTLWPTQRITNNSWYIFMKGAPKKPIFELIRQPLQEHAATMDTSDFVKQTRVEYIQWDSRGSASVAVPYAAIAVQ